jgi:uncharacterized protein YciI
MKAKKEEFIYVLKLYPELLENENWTPRQEKAVDDHFENLKVMLQEGTLILAGKTKTMDEKTFGIVIFEADSLEAAENIMKNDPAVMGKVMTAELFPYKTALIRESGK